LKLSKDAGKGTQSLRTYLFFVLKILAIRLRNNKNINGIDIDGTPILLSQYADDTSIILDGKEISLKEYVNELNILQKFQD